MLRHLLIAISLLVSPIAHTETFRYDYPIICDGTKKIIETLEKTFSEKLTWQGEHAEDKSIYSLWTNEKTGGWTLLKMTPETSCILGTGEGSKLLLGTFI